MTCKDVCSAIAYWTIQHYPKDCPSDLGIVIRMFIIRTRGCFPEDYTWQQLEQILDEQLLSMPKVKDWEIGLNSYRHNILSTVFAGKDIHDERPVR